MKLNNIYRFFLVLTLIFHIHRLILIEEMKANPNIINCQVVNLSCGANGGSSMGISYLNDEQWIEIPRKICVKTNIGDVIKINYNKEFDFFYINGYDIYFRQFVGLIILLVMTFINWGNIRARMGLN